MVGPTKVKIPIGSDFWRNCLFSKSIVTCFLVLGGKKDDIKDQTLNTKSLEIKSKKLRKKNPNPVYPIKDKISNKNLSNFQ